MLKPAATLLLLLCTALAFARAETPVAVAAAPTPVAVTTDAAAEVTPAPVLPVASPAVAAPTKHVTVYVIPVREAIDTPILYILRRGLKEAIDQKADAVVLDMDTPGGALGVTFDIMEALEKFPGTTITYINKEAMSAGAFISATTQEIWFAPRAVIGAAAPVSSGGKDIDVTMKQKLVSYLKARVRAISEGKGYRGEVVSAMIDADVEFKIGDKVIKAKGELLSLTDTEAMKAYGEPPQALLGTGIVKDIDALLAKKYGAGNFTIKQFQVTWSEELAQYLNKISPVLLGLGLLALFIEFKTPGFGIFGVSGIVLLVIVFLSNYVAGLSGHEPLLVFTLGLLLLVVELFFFPGVVLVALIGLAMMFGSLIWAMADLWPGVPLTTAWSSDVFVAPLQNLGLGIIVAVSMAVALLRFLPKGWLWDRLVLEVAADSSVAFESKRKSEALIGKQGVAVTALFPSGFILIEGKRFEAKVLVGNIEPNTPVVVISQSDFTLIVDRA